MFEIAQFCSRRGMEVHFLSRTESNPLPPRHPLQIFHITAIPNLVGIAKSKKLFANAVLQKKKMQHENIAYQGAQGKRATKLVAQSPGGVIHDYVPFYFAPRSPMLRTIDGGNVENCPFRQTDIAHLGEQRLRQSWRKRACRMCFYDYNATLDIATRATAIWLR